MNLILLGAPGAGKGTQAALIAKELGLVHLASGDLFREEVNKGSELGKVAKSYMEKGLLVPDDLAIKMILGRLATLPPEQGSVLDGFPRTLEQAQALDRELRALGRAIDKAVYLEVLPEELVRRLSGRWICRRCQAPYHLVSAPPRVTGRCDKCGGELYQRADDKEETVRKRLEVYLAQTSPLLEHYRREGKLLEIRGEGSVEDVKQECLSALRASPSRRKGGGAGLMGIIIKSAEEIALMRKAGKVVAALLETLSREIKPGMRTKELDMLVAQELARYGALSSFKGYRGFPANLCVSVNDEVVHGIPGERVLKEGDIVSLDVGAIFQGFQGDAAITLALEPVKPRARELIAATRQALIAGIAAARAGASLGDVCYAIQASVENRGFSVIREYTGHGIGREMHEEPQVPNFGTPGQGPRLRQGMTLALEPMVSAGDWHTRVEENLWTVYTQDGSLAAHFEHTIVITDGDAEVLTAL